MLSSLCRARNLSLAVCVYLSAVCLAAAGPASQPVDSPARGVGSYRGFAPAVARIEFPGEEGPAAEYGFERGQSVRGLLHLPSPVKSEGTTYTIRISDSFGRQLVSRLALAPKSAEPIREIPFEVGVPNAVVQRHYLQIFVSGSDGKGYSAERPFLYRLPAEWTDYICGVWQRHNVKRIPWLQEMYATGSQWMGSSPTPPQDWVDHNYWFYLEGTGNWVYSPYHIYMADRDKNYYFKEAKKAFAADRTNLRNLERDPCLSNHVIQERIRREFGNTARLYRNYRPLYYTVADEPGIGDQASAFDFCFSPSCQARFRAWLQERYPSLEALNGQWGTSYKTWDDVRGATTDEIFARDGENFSQWCDHKEFMDDVLIGAYGLAGEAVKKVDKTARLGVGGVQGPVAVGGWDFWKICNVFDVIEAYYIGNNYELMRSFNPNLIPFHCSFAPSRRKEGQTSAIWNPERHLTWYLFIHGDRGLIAWDDPETYVNDKGEYDERAKESKALYEELTGGIGKLRIASQRTDDPIALYYSQPAMRVHWVREVRPRGKNWVNRGSGSERTDSRYFRLRESWVKLIEDNGMQYKFLASEQVKAGQLKYYDAATGTGFKVLILPEILAMSAEEAKAIQAFVAAGGTVMADRLPGTFDEHGRKLDASPLADLFKQTSQGKAVLLDRDMLSYYHDRLFPGGKEDALKDLIGDQLREAVGVSRVTPDVLGEDGKPVTGVEATVWRNGQMQLIGLHRNPQLRVHELGPQEYQKNDKFEVPVVLKVKSNEPKAWYDVRAGRKLDISMEVRVVLEPFEPTFLAAFSTEPAPFQATVGADGIKIVPPAGPGTAMAAAVYHLAFLGPDGKERLLYRMNAAVPAKGANLPLPLAINDDKGTWTLEIREVATGATQRVLFDRNRW